MDGLYLCEDHLSKCLLAAVRSGRLSGSDPVREASLEGTYKEKGGQGNKCFLGMQECGRGSAR